MGRAIIARMNTKKLSFKNRSIRMCRVRSLLYYEKEMRDESVSLISLNFKNIASQIEHEPFGGRIN
ncbi:hypothetical protein L0Z72_07815 [candidate division KSB1 bacterium]|nr:hypothetical protein [candidate division KSB1 bacterium]